MRRIIVYNTVVLVLLLCFNSNVLAQKKHEVKVVKLQTSAHSDNCKAKIEKTLAYEKGIVKSELNTESQILVVTFKPHKTNVNKIIKVINDLGHDAEEIVELKE